MKTKSCPKCGKVIEGYGPKHVDYLMEQHNLKHRFEQKQIEANENDTKQ